MQQPDAGGDRLLGGYVFPLYALRRGVDDVGGLERLDLVG
jgi:hypothetical protein